MAGKAPRRKGIRGELEVAKLLGGQRVPLSGAAGGKYTGDVDVPALGIGEVKRRKNGFRQIYKWLGDNDFLAIRADRQPWLVVMPIDKVQGLIRGGKS
jgi:hypothetical protein